MVIISIGTFSIKIEHIKDQEFNLTDHLNNVINFKKGDINLHSDLSKYNFFQPVLLKIEDSDIEKLKNTYKHEVIGKLLCLNVCEIAGVESEKVPRLYISLGDNNFVYFIGILNDKVRRGVCAQKDQITASSDYLQDFKVESEALLLKQDILCYGLFEKGHFTQDFQQKILYKTGEEYEGYVNENFERDQSGKYTFDGHKQVYFGDFQRNIFHGEGRLEDQNTFSIYEGMFKDGKRCGEGDLKYKNLHFIGKFDDNMFEGKLETTVNEEVSVEEGKYNLNDIVKKMDISQLVRE